MSNVKDQDEVNHPSHYKGHPSGVECITITEHMNFCLGNALKYIWRAGSKAGTTKITDLKKARWYIDREISRLENTDANLNSRSDPTGGIGSLAQRTPPRLLRSVSDTRPPLRRVKVEPVSPVGSLPEFQKY